MAATVYSTLFVAVAPTGTNTIYYTVPAGNVAVVRTMTAGWSVPGSTPGTLFVLDRKSGGFVWAVPIAAPSTGSDVWNGRWVLNPTDTIRASSSVTSTVYLTVSGYLLTL